MEAETTRAQATAVKDHTKLTEADFPGSFRFFFQLKGMGGHVEMGCFTMLKPYQIKISWAHAHVFFF